MIYGLYLFCMPENKEIFTNIESPSVKVEIRQPETKLVDLQERQDKVPEQVKSWLQKIETDPGMANPISDSSGQQLITPVPSQTPKVVLPITRTNFVDGFKKTFDDAGRWLSTFLLRLIKMKQGNVKFKEEDA